jgi:hypothetical protein
LETQLKKVKTLLIFLYRIYFMMIQSRSKFIFFLNFIQNHFKNISILTNIILITDHFIAFIGNL